MREAGRVQRAPRLRPTAPLSSPVLVIALSALLASTVGCAYSGSPVAIQAPNRMTGHVEAGGLVVGAESYATPEKAEFAFGEDITRSEKRSMSSKRRLGFLPVLVSIRNDTDEHVLIDRVKSRLVSADGKTSKPGTWQSMFRRFRGDEAGASLALGVAGGEAQRRANDAMASDWQKKELPDQKTLAPNGDGVGGFIYFRDRGGEGPYTLVLAVEKLKSSKSLKIEVVVAPGNGTPGAVAAAVPSQYGGLDAGDHSGGQSNDADDDDDDADDHDDAGGEADVEADVDAEVKADAGIEVDVSIGLGTGKKPKSKPALVSGRIKIIFDEKTKQLRAPEGVILFELDSDKLKNDDHTRRTLNAYRRFLRKHRAAKLRIEGHTDSRGDDAYNLDLSHRRARTVRRWLVDKGIKKKRLKHKGKGERSPRLKTGDNDDEGVDPEMYAACKNGGSNVPDDCEEAVWSKNRRVEFHVTAGAGTLVKRSPPAPSPSELPPVEPTPTAECPLLIGPRLSALGPASYLRFALALQPVCSLELSLGIGFQFHVPGDVAVNVVPILLRGRFWFVDNEHSPIVDVGLGPGIYVIDRGDIGQNGLSFAGSLGLGYGYRSESAWRFGLLLGAATFFPPTPLESLFALPSVKFGDDGVELGLYGEGSVGYMF